MLLFSPTRFLFSSKLFDYICKSKITIRHFLKSNFFRPIDQRWIISVTSFIDLLQYVNNLKKRSSSRPNSMASGGSKIEGKLLNQYQMEVSLEFHRIKTTINGENTELCRCKIRSIINSSNIHRCHWCTIKSRSKTDCK